MSAKLIVVVLCAAIGTATGYMIMRSYRRNFEYLDGLCEVVNELKRNIAYRRDGTCGVLRGMTFKCSLLGKNVGEYVEFATGKQEKPNISRGFLPADIHASACEFFAGLGGGDGGSQLDVLNMYADKFGAMRSAAETKSTKYGGVAVKLGFLVGLGIGILVL